MICFICGSKQVNYVRTDYTYCTCICPVVLQAWMAASSHSVVDVSVTLARTQLLLPRALHNRDLFLFAPPPIQFRFWRKITDREILCHASEKRNKRSRQPTDISIQIRALRNLSRSQRRNSTRGWGWPIIPRVVFLITVRTFLISLLGSKTERRENFNLPIGQKEKTVGPISGQTDSFFVLLCRYSNHYILFILYRYRYV